MNPATEATHADTEAAGRDPAGRTGDLISVDMAIEKGLRLAVAVQEEQKLDLQQACGRVLSRAIASPHPQPLFDNSAMDGFALRRTDLTPPGPWHLTVQDTVAAGDSGAVDILPGKAVRILTGAPVPEGCDAVIMQEHVRRDGDTIRIERKPRHGENIRRRGEDITQDAEVLSAGVRLAGAQLALVASTGCAEVSVRRKVRVAIFSTGTELKQPGEPLGPGQIYNSNRFMLQALLADPSLELHDLRALPDDPEQLAAALAEAAAVADVVISTGGVSVGDEDHMPRLVCEAGGELHVMKVAMKPGKPVTIGTLDGAVYIGLPGNPVAAFVTYTLIARPIIETCAGLRPAAPLVMTALSGFERQRRQWRREYLPARIRQLGEDGTPVLDMIGRGSSAAILPLAIADGLAIIEPGTGMVSCGGTLGFMPLGRV